MASECLGNETSLGTEVTPFLFAKGVVLSEIFLSSSMISILSSSEDKEREVLELWLLVDNPLFVLKSFWALTRRGTATSLFKFSRTFANSKISSIVLAFEKTFATVVSIAGLNCPQLLRLPQIKSQPLLSRTYNSIASSLEAYCWRILFVIVANN